MLGGLVGTVSSALLLGCKSGCDSEEMLEDKVRPMPWKAAAEALPLLNGNRIGALLADGLLLKLLQKHSENQGSPLVLRSPEPAGDAGFRRLPWMARGGPAAP